MVNSKHLRESGFVPGVLNHFGGLSGCEDDGSRDCLVRVLFREHELLLYRLQCKIIDVAADLLQSFAEVFRAAAGYQTIIGEEDALVEVILDKVERRDCVQVPAEHSKQVELAALNSVEAGV